MAAFRKSYLSLFVLNQFHEFSDTYFRITYKFEHEVKKVKDKKIKERLEKNIKIIIENPEIGKFTEIDDLRITDMICR